MALEGIDGSGKSSVARRVAAALRREGRTVWLTREPTPTWLGRAVRRGIRSGIDPLAMACLFLADRSAHVRDMLARPERDVVITDRYRDSTTAYQAAALEGRMDDALVFFAKLQDQWFPAPDLALLLDLPPRVGLARIHGRRVKEPYEKVRFLERVRKNYHRLADEGRLQLVDADRPIEEVADQAVRFILDRTASRPTRK